MSSIRSRVLTWIAASVFGALIFGSELNAQTDPDPNSPVPVLLTQDRSPRALTPAGTKDEFFEPGSRITLYVANLEFMEGEGANSLRLYGFDAKGREYRFPVLGIRQVNAESKIFAVKVLLTDEIRYYPEPDNGDLAIEITWRGLASNKALLGYGGTGGINDDPGIIPVPIKSVERTSSSKQARSSNMKAGPSPEYVGYIYSGDRNRFLQQATFGPTHALDTQVRRNGIRQYLAQQFIAQYPSPTNPYPNQPLKPANALTDCDGNPASDDNPFTCFRDTYTMYQIQNWFHREALYGNAQLRHRVAWALSQIWVTSGVDIQQSRHMVEYHKVLANNAFGNFRDLMVQMSLNPTMGDYLDMARSTKNNPNENYAREIMQLFTVGLFRMNQDGTLQCVEHNPCLPGDTPVPTYDQNVVNDMTKVLTGWTFCSGASCPNAVPGTVDFIDPMVLNTSNHDLTAKTLLSYPGSTTTNIPACAAPCTSVADRTTYANNSLNQAMDNIFNHPNVGPFISRTLIQHLVTSDPTPAYISRVAGVFNNNGFGVRGDLKAVIKAILLDPEARGDVKTDPNYGKLREPVQFATNILRQFGVRDANGTGQSDGYLNGRGEYTGMAQDPFRSPTVFNYYPPDYVIAGTSLRGPEFMLMTTGTSITRANFVNRMVFTSPAIPISAPNAQNGTGGAPNGTSLDFSDLQALATSDTSGNLLVEELNRRMLYNTMSPSMKSTILTAVTNIPATSSANFLQRARQAVYLVASSSQYQVQR